MIRITVILLGLLGFSTINAHAGGVVDKARLQAAMQQHIERNLVNGAILHLDTVTGEVRSLYPTKAHPMVIEMGDYFILCADLRDKAGKAIPLDLYMAPRGRSFTVFHTEINNRVPLNKFMKKGLAKPLR